jgi:aspartyl-tRNA(Asn)/glutamyl-tRNA(Gln) amidotransferase subunit A
MARTAKDCALLLQAMAGFDTKDSTSTDLPVPDYLANLEQSIRGLKIGLPTAFFKDQPHPGVAAATEEALSLLKSLGATLESIELTHSAFSVPTYYVIAPAECSSNLSRYDGVRFGYRSKDPISLDDLYTRSRTEGFGTEVKRRILIGTHVLSSGYYDAYYRKAQQVRQLIADDFKKAFERVDLIVSPTTPTPTFALGDKAKDPLSMYLCDIYTVGVNLAGLPALSMPAGFVDQRPVGLQLIANHFEEARLLNVAHQFQQHTPWHQAIPDPFGVTR